MVRHAAGPPDTMTSAEVTSPPLADVAFIDADGDAAATDSDASERAEAPGSPAPRPETAEAALSTPTGVTTPRPLKSALKRGAARRRLQVVINESRNTYCEAEPPPAEEDAPLLVRAFSLRLPELLSCQSPTAFADAVSLSPPDAYRDIVDAGELCQETVVDDSEGSECSAEGLEAASGPAPLARLDDDIALETTDDGDTPERTADTTARPGAGGAEDTERAPARPAGDAGPAKDALVGPLGGVVPSIKADAGEIASDTARETAEDAVVTLPEDAARERAEKLVLSAAGDGVGKQPEPITAEVGNSNEREKDPARKPTDIGPEGQNEGGESDGAPPAHPPPPVPTGPPSPPERTPRAAWRNLPDLVSDGARAAGSGSGSDPPSPPAAAPSAGPGGSGSGAGVGSVLTIANVQQHDKVMEIADGRAGVLLSGILKGGRLWAGGRGGGGGDSDDSGDSQPRRSVRFERPAPAPRLLQPPAVPASAPPAESDGESSLSSMDTVIARGGAPGARDASQRHAARDEAASDASEASGDSVASDSTLDALRQRAVAELALAAGLGRTSADVARAIEHNSLRRSLARASETRLIQAVGGLGAAARNATQQPPAKPAPGPAAAELAASGSSGAPPPPAGANLQAVSRDAISPPREAPPGRPASSAFSPPPDIEVPCDVREWKLSESLWPSPSPRPRAAPAAAAAAAAVTATPAPTPTAERMSPPDGAPPSSRRPEDRLDTLLSAPTSEAPAVRSEPAVAPVAAPAEPRRLQLLSPAGRKAADSRIHQAAQQLFSQTPPQPTQSPSRPSGPRSNHQVNQQPGQQGNQQTSQQANQQTNQQGSERPAQRLPPRETARQPGEQLEKHRAQWPLQRPAEAVGHQPMVQNTIQQRPARPAQQLADPPQQRELSQPAARELFPPVASPQPAWDGRLPQRLAGARESAASSADSRDSYSLDDIDDALSEPTPAASPPAAKAGSADSGYGSTDGPVAGEPDELAAFAEREAARTERLRQRYAAGGEEEASFTRRASVRGIKPRFECTSEILRQMQSRAIPDWARPREGRDARRPPAPHESRPPTAVGSTHALYAPELREQRDQRWMRYASAQHLPQSAEAAAGGGGGGGGRGGRPVSAYGPAPAEEWGWPGGPAPLPHGYVYPEYQPPRGPPLPPRQGQVRSTGLPPSAAHLPVYQSTPNLYMPPQPPPPQHHHQQHQLLMSSASTLPMRQPRQLDLYHQQQKQQPSPPAGWGGPAGPPDPHVSRQWEAPSRQQGAAGAPLLRHRPPFADGEWPPGQEHVRPFSSSDIYPQLHGSYGAGFAPQGYMRDVQVHQRST